MSNKTLDIGSYACKVPAQPSGPHASGCPPSVPGNYARPRGPQKPITFELEPPDAASEAERRS